MNGPAESLVDERFAPTTPRKDESLVIDSDLERKIKSIAIEFNLPIVVEIGLLSPSRRAKVLPQNVHAIIKRITFLYWKSRPALEDVLKQFRDDVGDGSVVSDPLDHLSELLCDFSKLVKEDASAYRLERSTKAISFLAGVNGSRISNTSSTLSPSRRLTSTSKSKQSPTAFKQSTLNWTSSKLHNSQPKDKHALEVPNKSTTKKRASEESLADSAKYVRREARNSESARSSFPSTTSLDVSMSKSVSTIPSMITSFSIDRPAKSFASTVATSVALEDDTDEKFANSSAYGDLDISQMERLMTSFDGTDVLGWSSSTQLRNFASDATFRAISASQKTEEDLELTVPEPLVDVQDDSSKVRPHAEHTAILDPVTTSCKLRAGRAIDKPIAFTPIKVTANMSLRSVGKVAKITPEKINPAKSARKAGPSTSEHRLIRNLPQHGLFTERCPKNLTLLPFAVRWECLRIARVNSELLDDLAAHPISDENDLYDLLRFKSSNISSFQRTPQSAWNASRDPEHHSSVHYKGKLTYSAQSSTREHLFALSLSALQCDSSSRLSRTFGSHRFLVLDIPDVSRLPTELKDQNVVFQKRFREWLGLEKEFLGRTWRAFHIQAIKLASSSRKKKERAGGYRVVLFATQGPGLESISIGQLLDWIIPLGVEENYNQGFCKAFARLDLSLSSTIPTVCFKPSQVELVADLRAKSKSEDKTYNDPALKFSSGYNQFDPKVMDDGCSLMSVGAAKQICDMLGLSGMRPSTFQGRINGCKGMWSISAPYDCADPHHQAIWIQINDSQKKVHPRPADCDDATCDEGRWTFELVKYGKSLSTSNLYLDFVPILEDRHVPRELLCDIVSAQLDMDFEELYSALDEPTMLRRWVHSQRAVMEENSRTGGIAWECAFPSETIERVIVLLESGFHVKACSQLATSFRTFIDGWTRQLREKLKVRLPMSTTVYGIADPTGCLKPGEVYLGFSETFRDETTGEAWSSLKGEVLVARHPSLRRSDIQKVKAVYKEELSHLRDVVVFATQGCWPLADKLQGGDYDGDTFWLCWDTRITGPFLNAPAPTSTPKLEDLFIEADKSTLKEVLGTNNNIDAWVEKAFEFKLQEDLVGQVTNMHRRLSYHENSIHTPKVNALADLHDLILDSAKNGYTFNSGAFAEFKKKHQIREPPKPAYEKLMTTLPSKSTITAYTTPETPKHNPDHIIDKTLFEIVNPRIERMKARLATILKPATSYDTDLTSFYTSRAIAALPKSSAPDPIISEIVTHLLTALTDVTKRWNQTMNPNLDLNTPVGELAASKCRHECYTLYRSIQPCRTDHPFVEEWMRPRVGTEPSTWELLKASAFVFGRHGEEDPDARKILLRTPSPALVFLVAGRELCYLKAMSVGGRCGSTGEVSAGGNGRTGVRVVTEPMYAMLKPRKEKIVKQKVHGGEEARPEERDQRVLGESNSEEDDEGYGDIDDEDWEEVNAGGEQDDEEDEFFDVPE